ncbi:response regulator [Rhodoplanes serenus]|uniref:Response regulator n=1 Tax=Rhodoplanes serenus TaxID=200615 RepID=A0A9X4XNH3_9BRAD|nr:response regulator [Rhodoplanes serenus]MTW18473.1 response regulator [Rhodoplanes serenus]
MSRKSVLAVEDGITMRLFYRDVLEKAGFVVEEAANGVEGLERALMTRFDLMVVDINMPKMNGYEMVRQVRGNPTLRSIPVLTISTEEKDDDVVKAYEAGANFYLVKPVRPDELTAVVRLLTGSIS